MEADEWPLAASTGLAVIPLAAAAELVEIISPVELLELAGVCAVAAEAAVSIDWVMSDGMMVSDSIDDSAINWAVALSDSAVADALPISLARW